MPWSVSTQKTNDTRNQPNYSGDMQMLFYANIDSIISYLKRNCGSDSIIKVLGNYNNEFNYHTGQHPIASGIGRNATRYQRFAAALGNEKAIQTNNSEKLKMQGNTVKDVQFSRLVIDESTYENPSGNYNNFQGLTGLATGTDYGIYVEVTEKNGQVIKQGIKIGGWTSNAAGLLVKDNSRTANLKAGQKYDVTLPSGVTNVVSIKFKASYYVYRGRFFFGYPSQNSYDQARIVTAGDRIRKVDEVEFEVKSNEAIPEIVIKKTDLNGETLKGAEFSATIEANGKNITLNNIKTNEAGEIIIYSGNIENLEIDNIETYTGTMKATIKETKAPDGYELNDRDIVAEVTFTNGKASSIVCEQQDIESTITNMSYTDDEKKQTQVATIKVKDTLSSRLRIRKVDGDSDVQRYLGGATFDITLNAKPKIKNVPKFTRTSDVETGYIDITDKVKEAVGVFGKYTGTITVKMKETKNPSGYSPIPELTISLEYKNGELINSQSANDVSNAVIDIAKDKEDVTIGIKNTKILEYINLAKIDSVSGIGIPGVEFRISMSSENEESHPEVFTSVTSSDGLIIIDEAELNKVGIAERYTGKLNLVIEEITTPDGYKTLSEPIKITVEYEDGVIKSANKQKGEANLVEALVNGIKTLKVEVPNDRKLPDIVISKKSLNNGELENIIATFNIKVTAEGKSRSITKNGQTVNLNSEIVIDSTELETLGIDGSYTGKLYVEIEETAVSDEAAKLPEKITVTLNMKDGRFSEGTTTNNVHTSIVDNSANIEIKVLNEKKPNSIKLSGKVWEELSGSKAHDIEIDGIYNPDGSLTQRKDTLLKDIEVTLYRKNGNNLEFVNVSKGTNPTFTDENGEYSFEVSNGTGYTYVVKFTYNGM